MTARKFTDEQEQAICQRYLAGENTVEIAKTLGVNPSRVSWILRRHNVQTRPKGESRRRFNPEDEKEVCQRYLAGESTTQLGDAYGVSYHCVIKTLKRNGIARRSNKEVNGGLSTDAELSVCRRYLAGENMTQLGDAYGVSSTCICRILEANKIKRRTISEAKGGLNPVLESEACRRYLAGESSYQLAKAYGISSSALLSLLERNGVQRRSAAEAHGGLPFSVEAEVCSQYIEGRTTPQIAKAYGVSSCCIARILASNGIDRRPPTQARGGVSPDAAKEICERYLAGESTYQLGEAYQVHNRTIGNILERNGVPRRSARALSHEEEAAVCSRYLLGENTYQLGRIYGVTYECIRDVLIRGDIERRSPGGPQDSVQHVLDYTGRHTHVRECEFYLFELARYTETHCKPGIAFDAEYRACKGGGEYGEEVLRLLFATRGEAYFLEQAVLDATRGSADCPEDLWGWRGASEIRAMPAEDLVPVVLRLADELEDLGPWEFAARYVPMTAAQRLQCQQRALVPVVA